jgi:hypothetical protein
MASQPVLQSEISAEAVRIVPAGVLATGVWLIFLWGAAISPRAPVSFPEVYAAPIFQRIDIRHFHSTYERQDQELGHWARARMMEATRRP